MATPRKPLEQKPQSPKQSPDECSLRGFPCAAGFGKYGYIREIAKEMLETPVFSSDGWRVPPSDPVEWDFRFIKTGEEAELAVTWEYSREVKWVYDYRAELFALGTLSDAERSGLMAGFVTRWKRLLHFHKDQHDFLDMNLLCGQLNGPSLWPRPWALGRLPEGPAANDPKQAWPKIIESSAVRTVDANISPDGEQHRYHLIRVDWSETDKRLLAGFKEWIKLERPKVRIKRRGGKDAKNLFAMLKRLAAYRLERTGLSYSEIQKKIKKHAEDNPCEADHDVLPTYAPSGFSGAVRIARELLEERFSQ